MYELSSIIECATLNLNIYVAFIINFDVCLFQMGVLDDLNTYNIFHLEWIFCYNGTKLVIVER